MRHIPKILATQHPDNAQAPYWEKDGDGFVSNAEEMVECVTCYQDLGADEFMWDWDGKYADEAVIDKLFSTHAEYFQKHRMGIDTFLTFRIPNIWQEKGYNLARALMVVLTAEEFAKDLKLHTPPLFELILPMTESAEQLIYIQKTFQELARFKSKIFTHSNHTHTEYVQMIPLIESTVHQMEVYRLLEEYVALHEHHFKHKPSYLRVFLARSDPALVSGLVPCVLANKIALSEMRRFEKDHHIRIYPIIGAGSLIFRGGFNPARCEQFIEEYAGASTVTMQSAFRYDYPHAQVKKAIRYAQEHLGKTQARPIEQTTVHALRNICDSFERTYQETLNDIVEDLAPFFKAVPKRRERRLHTGLLACAKREVGMHLLPRAIGFTAGFYSIGVPPELIGLGRSLATLSTEEIALIRTHYRGIVSEIQEAGRYLNKDNLAVLQKHSRAWKQVQEDVLLTEQIFNITLGPKRRDDHIHKNLTANTLLMRDDHDTLQKLICETGKIRKSLG